MKDYYPHRHKFVILNSVDEDGGIVDTYIHISERICHERHGTPSVIPDVDECLCDECWDFFIHWKDEKEGRMWWKDEDVL